MKTFLPIVLAILFALFIGGCKKATEPVLPNVVIIPSNPYYVTSAEADWKIEISQSEDEDSKPGEYRIAIDFIKDEEHVFPTDDIATLIINGNNIAMSPSVVLPGLPHNDFAGTTNLNPGSIYQIGFKFNGRLKMSADIKVPYPAVTTFPLTYNRHNITALEWVMPEDSQYQFIELRSFTPWVESGDDTVDRYRIKLNTILRNYQFPAEVVIPADSDIAQTGYTFSVNQFSSKIVNRVMLLIGQYQSKSYYVFNDTDIPINLDSISNTSIDWVLAFNQNSRQDDKAEISVIAKCLDLDNLPEVSDIVSVNIGATYVELVPYNSMYYTGSLVLNSGLSYRLVFKKNDQVLFSEDVTVPDETTVAFPVDFSPDLPVELEWSIASDNQYQFLELESFKDDGTSCGLHSNFFRQLSGSSRQYYVPAGVVQNYGSGTEYSISLKQLNYSVEQRVACMLLQDDNIFYYTKTPKSNSQRIHTMDELIRVFVR